MQGEPGDVDSDSDLLGHWSLWMEVCNLSVSCVSVCVCEMQQMGFRLERPKLLSWPYGSCYQDMQATYSLEIFLEQGSLSPDFYSDTSSPF